jgi:hypothetical protein
VKPTSMKYLEKKNKMKFGFQKIFYSDEEEEEKESGSNGDIGENDFIWKDNNDIRIKLD